MKSKVTVSATILAAALAVAGCQSTVETRESMAELPPMEKPTRPAGTVAVIEGLNGTVEWTVESNDGNVIASSGSNGCTSTRKASFSSLAPTSSWNNCGPRNTSGTQDVELISGNMWPLTLDSKAVFSVEGRFSDGSNPWSTERSCEVDGVVNLTVPAGTFDAYKVVCKDTWNTRTAYYAPEFGDSIAGSRIHVRRGIEANWQRVSITKPD